MRKLLLLVLVIFSFAFEMQNNKMYECKTVSISTMDGNQTVNILVTPKTEKLIKESLKDFFEIKSKRVGNEINVSVGKVSDNFIYFNTYKGYKQYINRDKSAIFMLDKEKNSTNVALLVPGEKLLIFYKCK